MAIVGGGAKPTDFDSLENIARLREQVKSGPYPRLAGLILSAILMCRVCKGSGMEFPGNPRSEKCEECDGTGRRPE